MRRVWRFELIKKKNFKSCPKIENNYCVRKDKIYPIIFKSKGSKNILLKIKDQNKF